MQLFKVFLPTCSAFYLLLVTLQFFKTFVFDSIKLRFCRQDKLDNIF